MDAPVVVVVEGSVVVVGWQVQVLVQKPQSSPTKPPLADPESHSSPGSTVPLPHVQEHELVQKTQVPPTKPPLGDPESHCSPGSMTSLPHNGTGEVVVVVVVVVDVELVLDVLLVVVVVVLATSGAHWIVTLRLTSPALG